MRHFFLLPCCWCRCLEGTFTQTLPFTHGPVPLFRAAQAQWAAGAQGTALGQPNFCWLAAGKAQGNTLFKKRDVLLGVLSFQSLLCTSNLDFEIYWWSLHIQTAADTSPCSLKGIPRTRRWSLLPHALTSTQTKQHQAGGATSFSGLFGWCASAWVTSLWDSSSKTKSVSLGNVQMIRHQVFSFYICMVLWTLSFLLFWQKLHHGSLASSHWKQVECCHCLQGEPEWLLCYFKV